MKIKVTNNLSYYPLLLRMVFEETGTKLAIGTGFVYEYENHFYLITNAHCVTGVYEETKQRLSKHAGFPSVIQVKTRTKAPIGQDGEQPSTPGGVLYMMHPAMGSIPLYHDDDYAQPTWYMHPEFGHRVDVVAVPICPKTEVPEHLLMMPINTYPDFEAEPRVADDVYVLGYPFGITDPNEFPVWKKGSIATEPAILYEGLPKMLIDTATRSGMSGSPVILMRSGIHNVYNGILNKDSSIGTIYGFVGVYSGRIGEEKTGEAQLGIVWRKEVIEEIIAAKTQGSIDFQNV